MAESYDAFKPAHTSYKTFEPENFPRGYEHDAAKRKAFIEALELEKQFPDATHRTAKPARTKWDGPPTEAALHPTGSKFELPGEFPAHLWNTDFLQE